MNLKRWMHARGSGKMVTRGGEDYLERFYLLQAPPSLRLDVPRKTFLHTFWMDDPDPLHDHPWDWGRVILRGSYIEYRRNAPSTVCRPGHVVWRRPAEDAHRVELLTDSVTTVFWHWSRRRTWGFYYPDGWRPAPEEGQDGRPMVGIFLPRKIGPVPKEVIHS